MESKPDSLTFIRLLRRFPLPRRALPALLAALVILLVAGAGVAYYLDRDDARQARVGIWRIATTWDRLRTDAERQVEGLAKMATADPALQEAMRHGDAEALRAHAVPILGQWREHFGVTHWTFITTERRVLLRVHDPGLRGDVVTRKTLTLAAEGNRPAKGLESGSTAVPVLRHVRPWHSRGTLLGYVEVGMEIGSVNRRLKDLLDVEVIAALHTAHTAEALVDEGRRAFGFPGKWGDHAAFVVTSQTLEAPPVPLFAAWGRFIEGGGSATLSIPDAGQTWRAGFVTLRDVSDRPVASLAFLSR